MIRAWAELSEMDDGKAYLAVTNSPEDKPLAYDACPKKEVALEALGAQINPEKRALAGDADAQYEYGYQLNDFSKAWR